MKYYVVILFLLYAENAISTTALDTKLIGSFEKLIRIFKDISEDIATHFDLEHYILSLGYPFEVHNVITEDGYNLTIHRIPYGRNERHNDTSRPVALFMHGLLSSSPDFLTTGPNRSLPLQVADRGYDVWLGNNRGNRYSRANVHLSPEQPEFWNFSFEEIGLRDLPVIIDYVLNATGEDQLTYTGHSQGTTQVFALLSLKPEYNKKIRLLNALAPVVFMKYIINPLFRAAGLFELPIRVLSDALNIHEILRYNETRAAIALVYCQQNVDLLDTCPDIVYLIAGYDKKLLDRIYLPVFFTSFPAGCSVKEVLHYGQLTNTGEYRRYDYGDVENKRRYGSPTPPDYNLTNVVAPVALYYGQGDTITSLKDVDRLSEELPNVVVKSLISYEFFNHYDFLAAKDVNELLYDQVIALIDQFNNRIEPASSENPDDNEIMV